MGCSFCGKYQNEVKKLIAGPTVYICNECVDICNEIITDDGATRSQTDPTSGKATRVTSPPIFEWLPCPSCGTTLMLTLQVPDGTDTEPPSTNSPQTRGE